MIKKLLFVIAALITSMGMAFAQVDVNKADQAALDGVKGIGPKLSKTIIQERKKGEFKDWADFETRVKGVGDKSAAKLSQAGLTVGGKSRPGASPASAKAAKSESVKSPAPGPKQASDSKDSKK
jgi:competence protein ComEA